MSNRRIELLQNMPIFGGLAVSTLELILELSRPAVVAQGDFFFRQGDSGTSTFVLESGRVAILRSHQGRDHLLRHLGPGDQSRRAPRGARSAYGPRPAIEIPDFPS